MKRFKLLIKLMRGNRLLYFGSIIFVGLATLLSLVSPLIMRFTLDNVIYGKSMELPAFLDRIVVGLGGIDGLRRNLWICGLALLAITIVNGVFQFVKGRWSAAASESIAKQLRDDLYDHIQRLPYDSHVKAETGDLIQRCTSDVETVRRFLSVQLVELGRAIIMLVAAIFIMIKIDKQMTLASVLVVPIIFTFAFAFFIKVQKAFLKADESEGRLSNILQENLTGVRVVRAFGRQVYEDEKFDRQNIEYRDLVNKLIRLLAMYWSLSDGLALFQIALVVVLGVYRASSGQITFGDMNVFVSYVSMLLWPIRQMGRILTDMGKTLVSVGRIQEILERPVESQDEDSVEAPINGDIVFENVDFEYEKGKPILKNLSFRVKQGQTVAILGPTGSGKSSLVHLLQRLYDYTGGSITIGGVELKKIDKKWLRRQVGLVLQEPFLYSKTIKENIRIARPSASDEEVYQASRIASVHDVISEFEKGYDTPVGEKGVTLSGGQKQRVAIARTIINDCSILIFDDSLSAVDTETDAAIRRELNKRSKEISTFIISHRVTTLAEADLILVLDEGRLIQSGSHQDLSQQPGLYQRIWSIQNSMEEEGAEDEALAL
ncbi:MAG: ABC transporter ATP-binding protein [Clostridiales bacterium]|nr:ABC transporter ATP-binding protein [Clostridiales bacterium]